MIKELMRFTLLHKVKSTPEDEQKYFVNTVEASLTGHLVNVAAPLLRPLFLSLRNTRTFSCKKTPLMQPLL